MSEIKVDTLTGKTSAGDITVTSEGGAATMQLQQGLAKAWVNFNGTGTPAINNSNNVSTLTDTAAGQQTFAFTNAMNNANYAPSAISTANVSGDANIGASGIDNAPHSKTTLQIRMHIGEGYDPADGATTVHGDLA